ncbi:hypothetical protein LRP88_13361 [Fusarium phalaenopsidis]
MPGPPTVIEIPDDSDSEAPRHGPSSCRVAGDVAKTLDIGGVSSVPRHLMLHGPGPIPRQDSPRENTTDIIGTLVIFLPSEHQGANVNLSIDTMSLCFSPASSSALDVSAISWLQDVKCEVDDLTSGYRLAITFSAKKEILGFTQYNLELREADSDDLEDNPEWACEEGEYSRRINDTAALIVPREHIITLIDFRKRVGYYGGTMFCQEAVENVLDILTADMERFPDDPKPRQALLDMMTRLSGAGEMLRAMAVERILELSLESGDTALYNKTLAVTSFVINLDAMHVAKLLEQHLAKEYLNKEDAVNWNDWLGSLTERSFQDFRQSCASLKFSIENVALSQSLDAWVLGVSDLKMETEQKWDSFDCSLALDWIKERSEKPDWILNRFLPNIAAHASRPYLFNLLRSLWLHSNDPGFLNANAMCRSIIQHGFDKLILRIKDFGYNGGTPEPVLLPFVRCIQDCHIGGLPEEASRLLAATSTSLAKSRHSWPRNIGRSRAIMEGLVKHLAGLFERGEAVPVPEFGELVELLIRDFIRTTMPPLPVEPNGWTYDARGCSCSDCRELRTFLASPVMQTWDFPAPQKRRKHIEEMLLGDTYSFRLETTQSRSPYTLVVTKTGGEHQLKVKKVARRVSAAQQSRGTVPERGHAGVSGW